MNLIIHVRRGDIPTRVTIVAAVARTSMQKKTVPLVIQARLTVG
ncbi:hypothetical protein [Arcanobacterium haemolyticum]|nr:hypothetical protein [Arcanobacterium haemolyticum]